MADDLKLYELKTQLKYIPAYKQAMKFKHQEAMIHVAKTHLGYDSKQNFKDFIKSYEKNKDQWNDPDFQEKIAETMTDKYIMEGLEGDKNVFKDLSMSELDKNPQLKNMLSEHYAGITKDKLQQYIGVYKEQFLSLYTERIAPNLVEEVGNKLKDSIISKVKNKQEHIDAIVNEAVSKEHIDKYMTRSPNREEAIRLLELYSSKEDNEKLGLGDLKDLHFFDYKKINADLSKPKDDGKKKK